jgi:TetR/AcrR family transcriptional repressor of lmrAB and yxaGH operons
MSVSTVRDQARGDARARMIEAAAVLLQTQGYHGTGLAQILAEANAPRGSLYFHFPGGKEQLALEALHASHAAIMGRLRAAFDAKPGDVRAGLRRFVNQFATQLEHSDFARGCPVATVVLESAGLPDSLRHACEQTYRDERAFVAERLATLEPDTARAARLAGLIQSAVLGGIVLAKAYRSTAPLREAAAQLDALLDTLPVPGQRRRPAGSGGPASGAQASGTAARRPARQGRAGSGQRNG